MDISGSNNYEDEDNRYPYQSILNLYESNLSPDVIASQLDISKDDVIKTSKSSQLDQQNKEKLIIKISPSPKQEMMN